MFVLVILFHKINDFHLIYTANENHDFSKPINKQYAAEAWISKETWKLADQRAALNRTGQESTREVCKARRDFQHRLQKDRQKRVQTAGSHIEGFLEAGRVKEEWEHLTRW